MPQKIATITNRFRLLGLTNPTEATFKKLAAVLIAKHCMRASPEQMYNIVLEMKNSFSIRRKEAVWGSSVGRVPV